MEPSYIFSDAERAYVQAAQAELNRRIRNVAEINRPGFLGMIRVSDDGTGLVLIPAQPA